MHTTAPAVLVTRTLLVIYIAGSQALFKEATYDRTDSDEEYNRHKPVKMMLYRSIFFLKEKIEETGFLSVIILKRKGP